MAAAASKNYQVRSISLPCRLQTTATRIGEDLTQFKNRPDKQEPISHHLSRLQDLYKRLHHLLDSPMARQAIARPQNSHQVGSILDVSVKILDVCGLTRDLVAEMKENLRDLQSALRRRRRRRGVDVDDDDFSNIETLSILKYTSSRKAIKRNAKKLSLTLKPLHRMADDQDEDDDKETTYVVKMIKEVNSVSFAAFESLLEFLVSSSKPKLRVPKWMQIKGGSDQSLNELERIDEALHGLCKGEMTKKNASVAQDSLKCLEGAIEGMENGLEGLFRQLIRTRASLLNILSQ